MSSKYEPTWMIDAIYRVTPAQLEKLGIKTVLTDLSNTLVAWNNPDETEGLETWLLGMEDVGITVLIASNNKDSRAKRIAEKLGLDYVARALKPTARGFGLAEEKLDLKPSEMLMTDDQIMTDIRRANTAGIRDVLVQPIVDTDGWDARINQFLGRKVMKYLSKKHPEMTWRSGLE